MKSTDPTEWANRRKAAIERAKQLKEERKNTIDDNHTFSPQLVAKRPNVPPKHSDSLDQLTNQISNDIMEMPVPAMRNRNVQNNNNNANNYYNDPGELPSPGSDALGKEVKKYGNSGIETQTESFERMISRPKDTNENQIIPSKFQGNQFKSKFLQQYEENGSFESQSNSSNNHNQNKPPNPKQQINEDDTFQNILRSDGPSNKTRTNRKPTWNDDTTANETFDSFQPPARRQQNPAPKKPMNSPRGNSDPPENIQQVSQARSKLSLLKSKIRQSESGSFHNSLNSNASLNSQTSGRFDDNNNNSFNNQSLTTTSSRLPRANSTNSNPMTRASNNQYNNDYDQDNYPIEKKGNRIAYNSSESRSANSNIRPSRMIQQQPDEEEAYGYDNRDRNNNNIPMPSNRIIVNNNTNNNSNNYNNNNKNKQTSDGYLNQSNIANNRNTARNISNSNPRSIANTYDEDDNDMYEPPVKGNQHRQQNNQMNNRPPSGGNRSMNAPPVENRRPAPMVSEQPPMEYESNEEQLECPDCGRKFNPIPYEKHIKICAKVFLQKRKVFDSTKMRVQDNPELVKIITQKKKEEARSSRQNPSAQASQSGYANQSAQPNMKMPGNPKQKMPSKFEEQPISGEGVPKWKSQSNAFRDAMKAAREVAKAQAAGAPLPPPKPSAPDPSFIPCPHCGRRFNEKAAERHIPKCQSISAKPTTLKKGSGINASSAVNAGSSMKKPGKKF